MAKAQKSRRATSRGNSRVAPPESPHGKDKTRHTRGARKAAPALRGSDWPTTDLLNSRTSTASRKRVRTSEARGARLLH